MILKIKQFSEAMQKPIRQERQAIWGRLIINGNPTAMLAEAGELKDAPRPKLNGLFRVPSAFHVLNKLDCILTFLSFTVKGGQSGNGNLLGTASEMTGEFVK